MLASNAKTSKDKCITENNKKKKEEVTAQSQSLHTAHENAPSTSSAACNCPSELSGSLIMSNSVATQYSNSSFYDSTLLTPPDLPSDVEDEVLLAYNPNEPRYCICNQISYGSMIACDNKKCPYEWFHFSCVGVKKPPKGKWYCPICRASMSRKSDARRGSKRKIPY